MDIVFAYFKVDGHTTHSPDQTDQTGTDTIVFVPQTKEARLGWGSYLSSIELPLPIRISRRRRLA